jgi:hypothetical protein
MKDEMDELKEYIDNVMFEQNNRGIIDFEGYSANEMHSIMYFTFEDSSPIKLLNMDDSDYESIPILNQTKYLMNLINNLKEIKLTKMGFLPTKFVEDIYNKNFLGMNVIPAFNPQNFREADYYWVYLSRILLELSGLTKKRNNKLTLTKVGKTTLLNNQLLFKMIFNAYTQKLNWEFFDIFPDDEVGRMGLGFSLILISKYGNTERLSHFYSKKYFKAFPFFVENVEYDDNIVNEKTLYNCYSKRTFGTFLRFFGLVNIKNGKDWFSDYSITKTELFDKLIKCQPPTNRVKSQLFN